MTRRPMAILLVLVLLAASCGSDAAAVANTTPTTTPTPTPAPAFDPFAAPVSSGGGCVVGSADPDDITQLTIPQASNDLCSTATTVRRRQGTEIDSLISQYGCPESGASSPCSYTAIAAFEIDASGQFAGNKAITFQLDFSPAGLTTTYECLALSDASSNHSCQASTPQVSADETLDKYAVYRIDTSTSGKQAWKKAGSAYMKANFNDEIISGDITHLSTVVIVLLPPARTWLEFSDMDAFAEVSFELPETRRLHVRADDGLSTVELPFTNLGDTDNPVYVIDPEGQLDLVLAFRDRTNQANGTDVPIVVSPEELQIGTMSVPIASLQDPDLQVHHRR